MNREQEQVVLFIISMFAWWRRVYILISVTQNFPEQIRVIWRIKEFKVINNCGLTVEQ